MAGTKGYPNATLTRSRDLAEMAYLGMIRDPQYITEQLAALRASLGELAEKFPGMPVLGTDGQLSKLGVGFAILISSYAATVQTAYWLQWHYAESVDGVGFAAD